MISSLGGYFEVGVQGDVWVVPDPEEIHLGPVLLALLSVRVVVAGCP